MPALTVSVDIEVYREATAEDRLPQEAVGADGGGAGLGMDALTVKDEDAGNAHSTANPDRSNAPDAAGIDSTE